MPSIVIHLQFSLGYCCFLIFHCLLNEFSGLNPTSNFLYLFSSAQITSTSGLSINILVTFIPLKNEMSRRQTIRKKCLGSFALYNTLFALFNKVKNLSDVWILFTLEFGKLSYKFTVK